MQKRSGVRTRGSGKRAALGAREKRRLIQLALCVGLFLAVFLGKGIAPEGLVRSGRALLEYIRTDTDFRGAFSALGEAFSQGQPVMQTLGDLAREVFGAGIGEEDGETGGALRPQAAARTLTQLPTAQTMLGQLGVAVPAERTPAQDAQSGPGGGAAHASADTGPALPEGASMDYVDLGLDKTVTPVLGELTSGYGYRDHPVKGEYLFHTGADLAADKGTPVAAFADGTVEFVGESDAYGLYIQLDHDNGVTTFYCHCSDLYAHKGETVRAGQTIAAVGDTGNATGPHLHLEIEKDGVRLDPVYYVETLAPEA